MFDLRHFYKMTNPTKTLAVENREDRKCYIDFSPVRGDNTVEKLRYNILDDFDESTCSLFAGHIGCGKSTELLCLKARLQEQDNFHVVYFESDQDLEMGDVDVGDILLAITHRVDENLKKAGITLKAGGWFQNLFNEFGEMLSDLANTEINNVVCNLGIAEITAQSKASPSLRNRLRGYLEPRTNQLIDSINKELLEPAIEKLKHRGKQGLVVIVDNLDRINFSPKSWGQLQPEYLFIDRSAQLKSLHCHVVYTIPLALLRFSEHSGVITQRFTVAPQVLPMVPVRSRDGQVHEAGMALLRQMVLARGFPDLDEEQRLQQVTEIFDSPETLDRLCSMSGGHVRNLLRFLHDWIKEERKLPLSREGLERILKVERNQFIVATFQDDWEILRQVALQKKVLPNDNQKSRYQKLLRNLLILEYYDDAESWFDVNPILREAEELRL